MCNSMEIKGTLPFWVTICHGFDLVSKTALVDQIILNNKDLQKNNIMVNQLTFSVLGQRYFVTILN